MKRSKRCVMCRKIFYNFRLNKEGQKIGKYTLEYWDKAKNCSRRCYCEWRKGKIFSDAQLKALDSGRGWNKGKPGLRGIKNPNWKGGNTGGRHLLMGQIEYKAWRRSVSERDNYRCQICKKRGVYLQADHIKPWALFPSLRYDLNNGRALCRDCHRKTDTYGDLRNYIAVYVD